MSQVLQDLLDLLGLEKLEEGLFRGKSQDLGFRHVFGGQVIGQSLSAAKQTLDPERMVHSFHCYFLLPGDSSLPFIYEVESIRDGRSISTRRVRAIQKGKTVFFMTASFHQSATGFDHQAPMPTVSAPDSLMSQLDYARKHADKIPEKVRDIFTCDKPIEIRPVVMDNPISPTPSEPVRHVWMKANGALPDDLRIHKYLLSYASDFGFLETAAQPHGVSFITPGLQIATIDHAMWFHREFRFDDWLLYSIESPSASNERGFVLGRFYNRQGELVASSAQEGVLRYRKEK